MSNIALTGEMAIDLCKPKSNKACKQEIEALYSKGYYDSNEATNPALKEFYEKVKSGEIQ